MAEERLVDDDKDKKYKIRVNGDGEEELVYVGGGEQAEEAPVVEFAEETDDEEAAVMTPEQYAEKMERERLKREQELKRYGELIKSAESDCKAKKFATALEFLEQAEEINAEDGKLHALRMIAYTRNFTDYAQLVTAAESAEPLKKYASAEIKQSLKDTIGTSLEENISSLRAEVKKLDKENEEKKAERAVKFNADKRNAIIAFSVTFALFVVAAVLCGYFASIIYTVSTGIYLIATCCCAAAAFILLIVCGIFGRKLNTAVRRVRQNNRNTSTALGRELLGRQEDLKAFIAIRDSLVD